MPCSKKDKGCQCDRNLEELLDQTVRRCGDGSTDSFDLDAWQMLGYLPTPDSVSFSLNFTAEMKCMGSAVVTMTCKWPTVIAKLTNSSPNCVDMQYRVTPVSGGKTTRFNDDGRAAARFCRQFMPEPEDGWCSISEDESESEQEESKQDGETDDAA